ncbi:MAG: hypothetical protein AB7U63_20105, partial [Porticoccaceae bacterium]
MTTKQKRYLFIIVLVGAVLFCLCAVRAIPIFLSLERLGLLYSLILLALMTLCRMLPIYIGAGRAMDISFVPVLACAITSDYSLAVVLFVLSTCISVLRDPETQDFFYPYARNTAKELFNT